MDEQPPPNAVNMAFWQTSENQLNFYKGSKENDWMVKFDDVTKGLVKIKTEIMEREESQNHAAATNNIFEGTADSATYNTPAHTTEESALIKGTELAFKEGLLSENEKIVFRKVLERVLILGKEDHSGKSAINEKPAPQMLCMEMAESGTSAYCQPAHHRKATNVANCLQDDRYFKMLKERESGARSNVKTMGEDDILEMIANAQDRCFRMRGRYSRSPSHRHKSRRHKSKSRTSSRSRSRQNKYRSKSYYRRSPSTQSSHSRSMEKIHKHKRADKHNPSVNSKHAEKNRKNSDEIKFRPYPNTQTQQRQQPTIKIFNIPRKINQVNDIYSLRKENRILRDATLSIKKKIPDTVDDTTMNLIVEIDKRSFRKVMESKTLKLYGKECSVREHITLIRCLRCYGFHHQTTDCTNNLTCGKCAGPHKTTCCKNNKLKCANCYEANMERGLNLNTNHCAWWKECQVFKELREIERRNIDY